MRTDETSADRGSTLLYFFCDGYVQLCSQFSYLLLLRVAETLVADRHCRHLLLFRHRLRHMEMRAFLRCAMSLKATQETRSYMKNIMEVKLTMMELMSLTLHFLPRRLRSLRSLLLNQSILMRSGKSRAGHSIAS